MMETSWQNDKTWMQMKISCISIQIEWLHNTNISSNTVTYNNLWLT
jgi:hypothetical protein